MILEEEGNYWDNEYYRCFGKFPEPRLTIGVPMDHVHAVQSAVMRHWVEAMKAVTFERGGGYMPHVQP